jgi:hypothetical protein
MNRVIAVAATLATVTAATAAVLTNGPAMAASRPAGASPAAGVKSIAREAKAAGQSQDAARATTAIAAYSDGGKYVTVVHCTGAGTPPPIRLGQPGTPLTAKGVGPSAGILAMLKKPNPYKTIYTCTVTVEQQTAPKPQRPRAAAACEIPGGAGHGGTGHGGTVCTRSVTLNTGFGGMAWRVAGHHPGR